MPASWNASGDVLVEEEAGDAVLHRVGQAAHPPDDRQRAVPLRAHLGEAAGLVQGGHEEDVGAGHQPVLEPVGEVELHADPVRAPSEARSTSARS